MEGMRRHGPSCHEQVLCQQRQRPLLSLSVQAHWSWMTTSWTTSWMMTWMMMSCWSWSLGSQNCLLAEVTLLLVQLLLGVREICACAQSGLEAEDHQANRSLPD